MLVEGHQQLRSNCWYCFRILARPRHMLCVGQGLWTVGHELIYGTVLTASPCRDFLDIFVPLRCTTNRLKQALVSGVLE